MKKGDKRITYADRQKIEAMERTGAKVTDIAKAVGFHRATIYNELVFVPSRGFLFFYPISYSPYKSRAIFIICGANIFKPSECYF